MKLGCIVRADRRGLAYQSGEFYRHMRPDVTVAVDMRSRPRHERWEHDFSQYPDAIVTDWPEGSDVFSDEALQALLSCDVIYTAETFYDMRLTKLAAKRKVATVRHINCELYWPEGESHSIFPTTWRLPHSPEGPTWPVPVPDDRITGPAGDGLVLHTAGWKAMGDRNGTQVARNAIHRSERKWRVTAQYGRAVGSRETNVETMYEVSDRWEMYDGCSMLVLPRRYGGLCLPAQEAAARGLAVVMTDIPPQSEWGIVPIPVHRTIPVQKRHVQVQELAYTQPSEVARIVDNLTGEALLEAQESAVNWARSLAWSIWADRYRRMLSEATEEM